MPSGCECQEMLVVHVPCNDFILPQYYLHDGKGSSEVTFL